MDGQLNACYNAIDRHVLAGKGSQIAVKFASSYTPHRQSLTWDELLRETAGFAAVLKYKFGLVKGDTAVIYMPVVPKTMIAMLACARLGVVHSVVFGGFAPKELYFF
jgi:propionyl-CoA synthetase